MVTIKRDLDTVFVAVDRLKVIGYNGRYGGQHGDMLLAEKAQAALARIRERLANSVPAEQAKMEGME